MTGGDDRVGKCGGADEYTGNYFVGILHCSGSAVVSGVALIAVWLSAGGSPKDVELYRVWIALASYPAATLFFYFLTYRWGARGGRPAEMALPAWGLIVLGLVFLFSGVAEVQRLAFWTTKAAVFLAAVSMGSWLAVVARQRGSGFWGAVRSVRRHQAAARKRSWMEAVGAAGAWDVAKGREQ